MADTNAEIQEASQALFCAVADYLGYNEAKIAFNTTKYESLADLYTKYTPPRKQSIEKIIEDAHSKDHTSFNRHIPLKQILAFLGKSDEWYKSTVNIALKVIKEVNTISTKFGKIRGANWTNIFYVRGDKNVYDSLNTLFDRANTIEKDRETQKPIRTFGKIDKWCPADIYFASDYGADVLKRAAVDTRKTLEFSDLNELVSKLIDSGDLLPLSLKKQPNNVSIHKVNFKRQAEYSKLLKTYGYYGMFGNKRLGIDTLTAKDLGGAPLRIKINSTGSGMFQIRHTKDNALKGEIVLPSGEARGGSVTGNQIAKIIKQADPKFSVDFQKEWLKRKADFEKAKRKIDTTYKGKLKDEMTIKASHELVGVHLNKMIYEYLEKNKGRGKKADKVIIAFYRYAASMSPDSAKHIVAK
jgi:hypothetical protein